MASHYLNVPPLSTTGLRAPESLLPHTCCNVCRRQSVCHSPRFPVRAVFLSLRGRQGSPDPVRPLTKAMLTRMVRGCYCRESSHRQPAGRRVFRPRRRRGRTEGRLSARETNLSRTGRRLRDGTTAWRRPAETEARERVFTPEASFCPLVLIELYI